MNDEAHGITLNVRPAPDKSGRFLAVATNGVGTLYRDTIDLNSGPSRNRFVNGVLQKAFPAAKGADDYPAEVRDRLHAELLRLADVPPGSTDPPAPAAEAPADPRAAALAEMPADVVRRAEALLDAPDLVKRVAKDVETLGVAGEHRLVLTLYLVGTSVQLPKPLSAIVRGPSSSGKSYTVRRVGEMFPPETVIWANSLTTNALYYMPPGSLRHRFVVAGERSRADDDDRAEATRALRDMISDGELNKWVAIKADGAIQTIHLHQQGPIGYVESTTSADIFAEDANRCLLLATDESDGQTNRILRETAKAAAGLAGNHAEQIIQVHHALQRMIPRARVVIPFAPKVAENFSVQKLGVEARRAFPHLLRLVEASCLLHFRQRERDAAGAYLATRADYELAAKLAAAPLAAAAGGTSDGAREFFARLQARFATGTFSTTQARDGEKAKRRTVYAWVCELEAAGVLEQTTPPKGRVPAEWTLSGRTLDDGSDVFPAASAVFPAG